MTKTAPHDPVWSLQDAKMRFSEVIRRARAEGPQRISVEGHESVVIISAGDYKQMRTDGRTGADLVAAMQACPCPDLEFEFPAVTGPVRDIAL